MVNDPDGMPGPVSATFNSTFYVGFVAGEGPRAFRPKSLFAALDGGELVEHFEVHTRKAYVTSYCRSSPSRA